MERVKIKRLLKNIPVQAVKGSKEVEVSGLCSNSKRVAPGDLFIAKKGLTHDGAHFIPDAIASGAVAILTDLYDPFFTNVVQIIHPDVASVEAAIAKEFYGHPSDQLFLVAITGTNGKTTTSYLARHLFERNKESCGLIGTIEWIVGEHVFPSEKTTPDILQNYKLFHEMVAKGCRSCIMEVSSHALDQGRVQSIEFDVALFTNLTQDHLDYHKTMDEYAKSKAKLFSSIKAKGEKSYPKKVVVNADSPYFSQMIADCPVEVLSYGIEQPSDLCAREIRLSAVGIEFEVDYRGERYPFTSSLIGRFNVYNLLASIGIGLARGLALKQILQALHTFTAVPGRLERVPNDRGINIFVDYAHTDDALSNVMSTLNELKKGRLITVFGCGGNRDSGKRPKMGRAVEAFSDLFIITSDNPRHEDPEEIIRDILTGLKDPRNALVIVDRAEAIQRAIQMAKPDDIVLIAGKGHENYQIFSHQTIDFDDRTVAKTACRL
ncbi:MAG: UDP-N-acetylmuramoyl-L-alanyl-D-glutamate--2,6-diaminopimelate ligase [Rhabdochlamydiaceae bacterium]|jgi:UDP-N-acetylmuramoyl-L-alanyl-D-glutamate--2,6-diaminopimelate ligase